MIRLCMTATLLTALLALQAQAADLRSTLSPGNPGIKVAGPLTFGPEGILFVGDPQSAAIFALDTGDAQTAASGEVNIQGINQKIAAALGTQPDQILINDLAVNPASGNLYVSVARGRGPQAQPVILRIERSGALTEVSLQNVRFAKADLPNPPEPTVPEGRRGNQRLESITDLKFIDGRLIIAGLSNEEFASKLRAIPFPFTSADPGTSVEIFHGAHGRFETRSPVRTFIPFDIGGKPHLLAAYTCTPLVKFPLEDLQTGQKVRGTTVAELGNRNRPLDMVAYSRGDSNYVLMANSSRGLMKIATDGIESIDGIEEKINGTAGLQYETIPGMDGVVQLDRLNETQAVAIVQQSDGRMDLLTIDLP